MILKRAAVVIPIYQTKFTSAEEYSLKNSLNILSKWDVFVIVPNCLVEWICAYKHENNLRFEIKNFANDYFISVESYNRLMLSKFFYKRFSDYEYILLVQLDALVFRDDLEYWCNKNLTYIGAPWFKGFNSPEIPLTFIGVGNGGFSLRKVKHFIKALRYPIYIMNFINDFWWRPDKLISKLRVMLDEIRFMHGFKNGILRFNEDVYWGMIRPKYEKYMIVPDPLDAVGFSFEVLPEYLYVINDLKLPFGCHAWERYNIQFWKKVAFSEKFPY